MKKLLLTLFVLAGMVSTVVASGPATLPGFKKRTPVHRQAENRQMPPATAMHARFAAPSKSVMRQAPAGMEYVDRLLKVDETLGSWVNSRTFEYDEYGFPKKVTSLSGSYSIYEYTWQVPGKIWASKKVCTYGEDGSLWYIAADITRTFYPDGAVRTSTSKAYNGDNISDYRIFEYDNAGNLIKETENRDNGEIYIRSYTYFPLLDLWLVSNETPYEKLIVTLDGDNGYTAERWYLENNIWKLNSMKGFWYDNNGQQTGGMDLWFGDNGASGYGNKCFVEESADGISETYYILDEDKLEQSQPEIVWLPSSKSIYSPNYYDPWIYADGQVRTKELYEYEDNQWVITFKKTITWFNEKIVKEVYEDYEYPEDSGTSYCMVLEDGRLEEDFYYDEATGNYALFSYDEGYEYYTYFDAAGNAISKFRKKNYSNDEVPSYEQWVNSAWSKCTGTVTLYESGNDSYVIVFDGQGRVVRTEEYENGVFDGRTEYTYTDNGFIEKYYDALENSDQLYLQSEDIYTMEGDIKTSTYYKYGQDGSVEYAYKVAYDTKRLVTYSYEYNNGEWMETSVRVEPLREILADGTEIYIERDFDNEGNVVNVRKIVSVEKPDYRLAEHYEWNAERGDWDGVWKNEQAKIDKKPFVVIEPINPEDFEDEYFFPVSDEAVHDNMDWCSIEWYWDSTNYTWVCHKYAPEYSYPDDYTQIVKYKSIEMESTETIRVDSGRRKLELAFSETRDNETAVTQQHLWAYDENGRVVSDIEYRADGDTWSYYYTYGPIEVISGIDDVISGSAAKVTVYNLQGICVLRDAAPGAIGNLPRGLYIINGRKVAVR